ncbi:hypothetical protein YC2023_039443 [Brassica napus]
MAIANFFTIGYPMVIKKRSRTHVNLVIMVHEKQYSLEELQTMVDDMDYGLRSEPLVGGCFEYNIGMGLKSEDLCNEGEKG